MFLIARMCTTAGIPKVLGDLIRQFDCRDDVLPARIFSNRRWSQRARKLRYHLVRTVEGLRRSQVDRIDVFFLHRWDDRTQLDESLGL